MINLNGLIAVLLVILCACGPGKNGKKKRGDFPYDLQSPDKKYELPNVLYEISGIAAVNDSVVACVGDEKGIVYFFSLASGNIISELAFTKKGDFEDLAIIKDTLYVMNSNGTIWTIKNYRQSPVISSIALPVEPPFELEGLCARGDTLYAAAKYFHNKKRNSEGLLPVWKLRLPDMQMTGWLTLPDLIHPDDQTTVPFHTSALLFDEQAGEWLFLSSRGKALIRSDYQGNIIESQSVSARQFAQPEGICQTPSGDLLISNEGRDSKADILLFHRKNSRK